MNARCNGLLVKSASPCILDFSEQARRHDIEIDTRPYEAILLLCAATYPTTRPGFWGAALTRVVR